MSDGGTNEDFRLAIAVCSSRDVKPQTNIALIHIVGYLIHTGAAIGLTRLDVIGGVAESLLSSARQSKLDTALSGGYSHLFTFDDDMTAPFDAVHQLAMHRKDFVCANACQKTPDKVNGVCLDMDGLRIDSTGKTGLEQVGWGTLACALIRLDAIRHLPKPHFEVIWDQGLKNGQGGYQGEDHYFMRKLRNAEIELYCDHDLTQKIRHIGDYPYGFPQPKP